MIMLIFIVMVIKLAVVTVRLSFIMVITVLFWYSFQYHACCCFAYCHDCYEFVSLLLLGDRNHDRSLPVRLQ